MKKSNAIKHLEELITKDLQTKFPNFPYQYTPIDTYKTTKNVEKRILKQMEKFLLLHKNCMGTIIENTGKRVDNTKTGVDVTGRVQKVGTVQYRRSGIRNGVADLKATIKGYSVDFELKRIYKKGNDKQSEIQKKEEQIVKRAGGVYCIVHDFEDFYEKFTYIYDKLQMQTLDL